MVVVVVAIPLVLGNPSLTLVQPTLSTSLDLPLYLFVLSPSRKGREMER